jgi:hypothetical protein
MNKLGKSQASFQSFFEKYLNLALVTTVSLSVLPILELPKPDISQSSRFISHPEEYTSHGFIFISHPAEFTSHNSRFISHNQQ